MKKRKGARWLDIGDQRWSYFVGQRFVEIRSPSNRATLVPRDRLDQSVDHVTYLGDYEDRVYVGDATMPGRVAAYIRANLRSQYEAETQ